MGSLVGLEALGLQNNSLHGDVSPSLEKCNALGLINLSHNNFSGTIPAWIVDRTTLLIIKLRSNKFIGNISSKICRLSHLRVLDLADNNLSGKIPVCLNNISAMAEGPVMDGGGRYFDALEAGYDYESYLESVTLNIKGRDSNYKEILGLVKAMDLSSNNLSGSIPVEIFSLIGLQSLNLSQNHFTGMLSVKIGGMEYLESLDLSRNHLAGEIPPTIASLTFLQVLDLSYNDFSGRIPSGAQLETFAPLSYVGNAGLCGPPLTKTCTGDGEAPGLNAVEENRGFPETTWFYISMGSGFIGVFWGVCGTLLLQREWRRAYFQFVGDMKDWVYGGIAITLKRFRQKLTRRCSPG